MAGVVGERAAGRPQRVRREHEPAGVRAAADGQLLRALFRGDGHLRPHTDHRGDRGVRPRFCGPSWTIAPGAPGAGVDGPEWHGWTCRAERLLSWVATPRRG